MDEPKENVRWPKWTVLYNGTNDWVGTGWEFYDTEEEAQIAYDKHIAKGDCPCKRPFHLGCDRKHLGAAHSNGRPKK